MPLDNPQSHVALGPGASEHQSPAFGIAFWVIFAVGLVARLWFNLFAHPPMDHVYSDMWVYQHRAEDLLTGHLGPWDTFTPPGYPALLALMSWLAGSARWTVIAVFQAVLGSILVPLTMAIARRILPTRSALIAAAVVSFYYPLIYYGGLILTEIPLAVAALAGLWLLLLSSDSRASHWRFESFAAGFTLACAAAIRPNALLLMPLIVLLPWWASVGRRRMIYQILLTTAGVLPVLSLVCVHNSTLLHRPTGLATNGGLNFFLAHSSYRGAFFKEGEMVHHIVPIRNALHYSEDYWSPVPFYEESYFYREGLRSFAKHPGRVISSAANLVELLGIGRQSYWPYWDQHEAELRAWSVGFFFLIALPAVAGITISSIRRQPLGSPARMLFFVMAANAFAGYLFLGDPRLRAPFDPLFIMMALRGVGLLATWRQPNRSCEDVSGGGATPA